MFHVDEDNQRCARIAPMLGALNVWVARPTTGGEWQYLLAAQTQSWWA